MFRLGSITFFFLVFLPYLIFSPTFFANEEILLFFSLTFMFVVTYLQLANILHQTFQDQSQRLLYLFTTGAQSQLLMLLALLRGLTLNRDALGELDHFYHWLRLFFHSQAQFAVLWLRAGLNLHFRQLLFDLANLHLAQSRYLRFSRFLTIYHRARSLLPVLSESSFRRRLALGQPGEGFRRVLLWTLT